MVSVKKIDKIFDGYIHQIIVISLILIIVSILTASLVDSLKIYEICGSIIILQKKSINVIRNPKISDNKKQFILLLYSKKILFTTSKLIALFIIAFLPFLILIFLISFSSEKTKIENVLISLYGILLTSGSFLLYNYLNKGMGKHRYNFLSRQLHYFTLGSKTILKTSFDIEKFIFSNNALSPTFEAKHIFITGLARSGTTALLNYIYESKKFTSLTYADMPFILSPNLWHKISFSKQKTIIRERDHKDGIFINNESPEALDEVFWKVILNDTYICEDRMLLNNPSSDELLLYNNYIDLIIKSNGEKSKQRYVSKNNNNILRIESIIKYFPQSTFIITYRDPLQHALSLQHQHFNFCEIQTKNPFVLFYMNSIGHHEFGLNQKPFFLKQDIFDQMSKLDKNDINFWLLNWLNYYTYMHEIMSNKCILISYEHLCRDPTTVINFIFQKIEFPTYNIEFKSFAHLSRNSTKADPKILKDCNELYRKLKIYSLVTES